jgi:uncharacterized alkaline shock family protein YloU
MIEGIQKDIELKIMQFFKEKPNAQDSAVHAFAEKLKINNHVFEGLIYQILGQFFGAGRAHEQDFTEKNANKKQLQNGIKIEYEHTNNYEISKRIALDHLAEIPDYYTRLIKMEQEAGIDIKED